MTLFWAGAALLLACAALFVLWPLLGGKRQSAGALASQIDRQEANIELFRQHLAELEAGRDSGALDEAEFERLKLELERSLLADSEDELADSEVELTDSEDELAEREIGSRSGTPRLRKTSPAILTLLALALPAAGFGLYWLLGASQDWQIVELANRNFERQQEDFRAGRPSNGDAARDLIASLEARLKTRPDNQQNWFLLARTRMELQDYLGAVQAYRQVLKIEPNAGQVMGELAQATFMAAGNRMTPEVEGLVANTLRLMPNNATALGLAGVAAFESRDFKGAIDQWGRALEVMGRDTPGARALLAGIARAERELAAGGAGEAREPEGASDKPVAGLSLRVSLAEGVPREPGQVIFVYARAWQGPKMPLAIQRVAVEDLPLEVTLDESMAMAPGMSITSFPELELVARLSRSGSATPQSGDWLGTLGPIKLAELPADLHLEIAAQLP